MRSGKALSAPPSTKLLPHRHFGPRARVSGQVEQLPEHNRAAIVAYAHASGSQEIEMRFLLGLILGCVLTVAGAYIADAVHAPNKPMVNWDVVASHVDAVTALARQGWKKITG